jgi:hypothetical protein
MQNITVSTSTGQGDAKVNYDITFAKYDSLEEYLNAVRESGREDAEQAALDVINSQQEQGAKQGGKGVVRDAVAAGDAKAIKEAIKKHQEWAPTYVVQAAGARGRIAGVTRTAAGEVGKKLLEADPDALKKLADELGISL